MKKFFSIILLCFLIVLLHNNSFAQGECLTGGCASGSCTYNFPSGTLSTTSSSWTTVSTVNYGGDYQLYSVTSGKTYEWTLCTADGGSASYDSYLTLYNNSGLAILCRSDDYCGDDAKIMWTATFTGTVRIC